MNIFVSISIFIIIVVIIITIIIIIITAISRRVFWKLTLLCLLVMKNEWGGGKNVLSHVYAQICNRNHPQLTTSVHPPFEKVGPGLRMDLIFLVEWTWFKRKWCGRGWGKIKQESCKKKGQKIFRACMKAKKKVMHLQKKTKTTTTKTILHKQWEKSNYAPHLYAICSCEARFRFCVHPLTIAPHSQTTATKLQPK